MSTEPFFSQPELTLPFQLAGKQGQVAVYYGPDVDPVKAGFDSLPGSPVPLDLPKGYPVMHARIESYAGAGYRMLCGWIQTVTRQEFATADQEHPDVYVSVDVLPALDDGGMPFCIVGMLPSMFDAPCLNLNESQALTWIADTYLVTVPLRSREEEITWLAGFRWGYREYAPGSGKPVAVLPVQATGPAAWNQQLAFLRGEFGAWRFKEA